MDHATAAGLKEHLQPDSQFADARELHDYFHARGKRQQRINIAILCTALIVGFSYVAFQEGFTIIVLAVLLLGSLLALFLKLRRETRELFLSSAAAEELYHIWFSTPTNQQTDSQ